MNRTDIKWLNLALTRGYEHPFRSRATASLRRLERRGLIEENPSTGGGDFRQWRITQKGEQERR